MCKNDRTIEFLPFDKQVLLHVVVANVYITLHSTPHAPCDFLLSHTKPNIRHIHLYAKTHMFTRPPKSVPYTHHWQVTAATVTAIACHSQYFHNETVRDSIYIGSTENKENCVNEIVR